MIYKIIKSTDHPVVATYMTVIERALVLKGVNVSVVDEKDAAAVKNLKNRKEDMLIVDSPLVALTYRIKGFRRFITWYQGLLPEESYINNHSYFRAFVLKKIEKYFLKKSKLLFFVSDSMLEHYEKKYNILLKHKTVIMPCFNEIGLGKDAFDNEKYKENTFVYVGGLQAWQCFDQTVQLYAEIEKRAKYNTKFYVYTFQKELAEEIIKKHGVQNYVVDCVDGKDLSKHIKRIKYGFVLREDNAVNNVATPTKISNYLANGIIPIYSGALKSFLSFDEENKLGIICGVDDAKAEAEKIIKHMREEVFADDIYRKCQNAFENYYNVSLYVKRIVEKLSELEEQN